MGVVESAGADVVGGGRERHYKSMGRKLWEASSEEGSEWLSKGAHGIVFVFMDDSIEKIASLADEKSRWQGFTMWATMARGFSFAFWAEVGFLV